MKTPPRLEFEGAGSRIGKNLKMIEARKHIMVVDDDPGMQALLEDFFVSEGYKVSRFGMAQLALDSVKAGATPDAVLSDIKMPQMDGFAFVQNMKQIAPDVPVILATGFGSIESAIEAMKRGAFDYVVKPFQLAEISVVLQRALELRRLRQDNQSLRFELKKSWGLGNLIGKSPGMKQVFDLVTRVAQATANILVTGESGTGKEMVARAIHDSGPRARRPFVAINCTAIPDTLLESELFGHAKGSFTGAIQRKRGLFEEAEGGTLFLDEIGDMDPQLQAKLLRVLQEKKIRAVGDTVDRPVDVRIVAATHQDLRQKAKEGRFREDLYYRLSVIPVQIPALRERKDDIPLLAEHFLRKYVAANGAKISGFTPAAMKRLMEMRWEGNVRELENLVERLVVLSAGPLIDLIDLPQPETESADAFFSRAVGDFPTIEELEKRYMALVLQKTGGRKDKAASILGINRRTLYRKEREYGFVDTGCGEDESALAEADAADQAAGR